MSRPRSLVSWAALAFSIAGIGLSAFFYAVGRPNWERSAFPDGYYIPLGSMALCAVTAFAARSTAVYRVALAMRILFYLACCLFTVGVGVIEILLLSGILLEISLCEPYPRNLTVTLSLTTVAILLRGIVLASYGKPFWGTVPDQLRIAVPGYAIAVLGSRLVLFREATIELQGQGRRLEDSIVHLTRTLSQYQDYSVRARESAANQERKRITRDIHDIVGYTLTNNIMLMETARDLMQENPLGIPATIAAARVNAEEGLARIRQAMYDLRLQETGYPVGVLAIHRLVGLFQKSTGIEVQCEFGDIPWTFPEEVDSALYHLVQESLVNSFRHGKAGRILLLFRRVAGSVHVRISDDGVGSGPVREGIGLRGMRERIGKLGGTVSASGAEAGFLVEAFIPIGEKNDGTSDPDPHFG